MNNEFIMLVGLPASGKSTYAAEKVLEGYVVVSSDVIRENNFKTPKYTREENEEVFREVHDRIKVHLSLGDNVIYDATNLSKRRHNTLQMIRSKFPSTKIIIRFFNLSVERAIFMDCLRKERAVGKDIILRMAKSYTSFYTEHIHNLYDSFELNYLDYYHYNNKEFLTDYNIEQDNPNHTKDLQGHTEDVVNRVLLKDYNRYPTSALAKAARYHDMGKYYTKTYEDINGNKTATAHYYRHEKVSSYIYDSEVLMYMIPSNYSERSYNFYVELLIERHMAPLDNKKNKHYLSYYPTFLEDLEILKEADKERTPPEKVIIFFNKIIYRNKEKRIKEDKNWQRRG